MASSSSTEQIVASNQVNASVHTSNQSSTLSNLSTDTFNQTTPVPQINVPRYQGSKPLTQGIAPRSQSLAAITQGTASCSLSASATSSLLSSETNTSPVAAFTSITIQQQSVVGAAQNKEPTPNHIGLTVSLYIHVYDNRVDIANSDGTTNFDPTKYKYYNGNIICVFQDHRTNPNPNCTGRWTALRPSGATLWNDILRMNHYAGGTWTQQMAIEIESKLLLAIYPKLDLNPTHFLPGLVPQKIVDSDELPVFIHRQEPPKRKRKLNSSEIEEEKLKIIDNDKLLKMMDPRTGRPFEPSWTQGSYFDKNKRPRTIIPPADSKGKEKLLTRISNVPGRKTLLKRMRFVHSMNTAEASSITRYHTILAVYRVNNHNFEVFLHKISEADFVNRQELQTFFLTMNEEKFVTDLKDSDAALKYAFKDEISWKSFVKSFTILYLSDNILQFDWDYDCDRSEERGITEALKRITDDIGRQTTPPKTDVPMEPMSLVEKMYNEEKPDHLKQPVYEYTLRNQTKSIPLETVQSYITAGQMDISMRSVRPLALAGAPRRPSSINNNLSPTSPVNHSRLASNLPVTNAVSQNNHFPTTIPPSIMQQQIVNVNRPISNSVPSVSNGVSRISNAGHQNSPIPIVSASTTQVQMSPMPPTNVGSLGQFTVVPGSITQINSGQLVSTPSSASTTTPLLPFNRSIPGQAGPVTTPNPGPVMGTGAQSTAVRQSIPINNPQLGQYPQLNPTFRSPQINMQQQIAGQAPNNSINLAIQRPGRNGENSGQIRPGPTVTRPVIISSGMTQRNQMVVTMNNGGLNQTQRMLPAQTSAGRPTMIPAQYVRGPQRNLVQFPTQAFLPPNQANISQEGHNPFYQNMSQGPSNLAGAPNGQTATSAHIMNMSHLQYIHQQPQFIPPEQFNQFPEGQPNLFQYRIQFQQPPATSQQGQQQNQYQQPPWGS
ncbi:hypothetical protein G9A89_017776 [Geosiphon pyriformis]|nr:hypothetical protein G9A89_017776 [Geosiphon pyriformis]